MPTALVIDPAGLVPLPVETALADAGYRPCREAVLSRALLCLFKEVVPLVIIGHDPPLLDATSLLRALRRAPDCVSRRAQIFVMLPEVDLPSLVAMRDSGASQISGGRLDAERLDAMLRAMRLDRRRFIDTKAYVGPDRRVKQLSSFGFTLKRQKDYHQRSSAYAVPLPAALLQAGASGAAASPSTGATAASAGPETG
jgi:hypothetical protein